MVKHQIHDEFRSFKGTSLIELSKTVSDFAQQKNVAVKSLSVVQLPSASLPAPVIICIGFRSEDPGYPVSIEGATLPNTGDLDQNIMDAADQISGDVICHALFVNHQGNLEVAFLLHE